MNETLKFSWGHIVAFMALIAVCYVSFVGYAYLSGGNFYFAIAGMILTAIVYFSLFIGVQFLEASGNKIEKKILWERILVFGSPFIFAGCMAGIAHFWTIKSQDDQIVASFKAHSIISALILFSSHALTISYSIGLRVLPNSCSIILNILELSFPSLSFLSINSKLTLS